MSKNMVKEVPISVDEEFLINYIDKGGKVESKTGTPIDADNLDEYLKTVGGGRPETTKLHQRAKKADAADTQLEDAEQAEREQNRINKMREREQLARQGKIIGAAGQGIRSAKGNLIDPILTKAGGAVDWASNIKTYGGIGLLLALLIFLLFVVVQVNAQGDTRMKQLWYMFNGRATLQGRVNITKQDQTQQNTFSNNIAAEESALLQGLETGLGFGDGGAYRGNF
jgi:hypothetical protein